MIPKYRLNRKLQEPHTKFKEKIQQGRSTCLRNQPSKDYKTFISQSKKLKK